MQQKQQVDVCSQSTRPHHYVQSSHSRISSQAHTELLKLEVDVLRMKNRAKMSKQLKKNMEQFNRLSLDIQQCEEKIKERKKEVIKKNMEARYSKQIQRMQQEKQSNHLLFTIKEQNKKRREQMESLVKQYKEQYDKIYEKQLAPRKILRKPIDFSTIKLHEHEYLQNVKKRITRIKTQKDSSPQKQLGFSPTHNQHNSTEKKRIVEMIKKRKEYSDKIDCMLMSAKQSCNSKRTRRKTQNYHDDKWILDKKINLKAKLDTNLKKPTEKYRGQEIKRIYSEDSPVITKMNKLRDLAEGYTVQHANGKTQLLDLISSANIARADLMLKQC